MCTASRCLHLDGKWQDKGVTCITAQCNKQWISGVWGLEQDKTGILFIADLPWSVNQDSREITKGWLQIEWQGLLRVELCEKCTKGGQATRSIPPFADMWQFVKRLIKSRTRFILHIVKGDWFNLAFPLASEINGPLNLHAQNWGGALNNLFKMN